MRRTVYHCHRPVFYSSQLDTNGINSSVAERYSSRLFITGFLVKIRTAPNASLVEISPSIAEIVRFTSQSCCYTFDSRQHTAVKRAVASHVFLTGRMSTGMNEYQELLRLASDVAFQMAIGRQLVIEGVTLTLMRFRAPINPAI